MGLRGPAPKPTSLKAAAGNPGRRQLNEGEPIPPKGEVVPPRWLGEEARQVWDAVAPVCIAMKTLTVADVYAFGKYCECFARWLELTALLRQKGSIYTLKDAKGKPKYVHEFPQAAEQRRLYELLLRMEVQFGLTPAARSRINVKVEPAAMPQGPGQSGASLDFFKGGGPKPPRLVG